MNNFAFCYLTNSLYYQSYFYQQENVLSGLSLSKENVTIRSGYESILKFYGYDLGDGSSEEGNVGMITTTQNNRREQDEPDRSTPMQTTVRTTTPRIFITSTATPDETTLKMEPPTTQYHENKVTEGKVETTTELPDEPTSEIIRETTTNIPENISKQPIKITTTPKATLPPTTIATTFPTTAIPSTYPTTIPTELPETTTPFFQTTRVPTSRFTYPPTEETTIFPVTEMMTSTPKPTHIFTFKPITTTPLPEPMTKRFYNIPTTIPPLLAIRSAVTDTTNPNSLTTFPVPTAIRLNPSDISNARFFNQRNSRTSRVKKDADSYNSFIPLAPSGYGVPSDVNLYDPYFHYATPNPPDLYYPEGNPIFATKDFEYADHHHDEVDHIFYLSPHDSIRIGFKVYNTILRFAYIPSLQASALELPLDSDNYSLLILVPDQPIEDMVHVLGSHLSPSLSNIRAALKENWIKTMIPKFQLKGNVVLTGDLMKVG